MSAAEQVREFDIIEGRRYRHVVEWLGSRETGQRTARWSFDKQDGAWFMSAGWKRPNCRARLTAAQSAFVESVIA